MAKKAPKVDRKNLWLSIIAGLTVAMIMLLVDISSQVFKDFNSYYQISTVSILWIGSLIYYVYKYKK